MDATTLPGTTQHETFRRDGYVRVRQLLNESLSSYLWSYVRRRAESGTLDVGDAAVAGARVQWADPAFEALLDWIQPAIEDVTGRTLHPTYSYFRVYGNGDELPAHHDRESCEISVSVNLGQDPPDPWPLWIAGYTSTVAVPMHPGDAVVYRGIDCQHWRDRYEGTQLAQLFLHYVDRDGPYAAFKFDGRKSLRYSYAAQPTPSIRTLRRLPSGADR